MTRRPSLATDSIEIEHRGGGASISFVLDRVSCHEVCGAAVQTAAFQRQCAAQISIFPGWSLAGGQDAGAAYRTPAAYKVTGEGWTMDKEDLVLLPSGRKGRITRIEDSRAGRCPHWYIEVT